MIANYITNSKKYHRLVARIAARVRKLTVAARQLSYSRQRHITKGGNMAAKRSNRGLANADKETRERVARKGGKSSHGGGRRSGS
jgi:ADP-glucose pyrophosphorylase